MRQLNVILFHIYFSFTVTIEVRVRVCNCAKKDNKKTFWNSSQYLWPLLQKPTAHCIIIKVHYRLQTVWRWQNFQASGSFSVQPQPLHPCILNINVKFQKNTYIFTYSTPAISCIWCLLYSNMVLLLLMFKLFTHVYACTVISHGFIYC